MLKGTRDGKGYWGVALCKSGVSTRIRIAVLVATAFFGPRPHGNHAAHRNGDKNDNGVTNIYWATPQENADDVERHGTRVKGSAMPQAILTEADVRQIRTRIAEGYSQTVLAQEYGVSHATISMVKHRTRWGHVA